MSNANYESFSPDAIQLSVRRSRLQRQLFVASSRVVRAIVSAPVISVRINVQLEAPGIASRGAKQTGKSTGRTGRSTPSCSSCCPSCLHIAHVSVFRVHVGASIRGSFSRSAKLNKTICSKANNGIRFTCE